MLFRWLLSGIDRVFGTEYRARHEVFRGAYAESKERERMPTVLSTLWIVAGICSQFLPGVVVPVHGEITPTDADYLFAIFALLAIASAYGVLPVWFYKRSGNFAYKTDWFPIQSTGHVIKAAQSDIFRAERTKVYDIAVIIEVPGKINNLDVQLHSNNTGVDFTVENQLPPGLESYTNDNGFSFNGEIRNDFVTPVLQIEKNRRLEGGPNTYVSVYDVSSEDSPPVLDEKLDSKGDELLRIKVTD